VSPLERFVEPAGHHTFLKMRVQHDGTLWTFQWCFPVQVQVVIGDAAIPIRPPRCARDVVHGFQGKRDGAARLQCGHEVALGQGHLPGEEVLRIKRQVRALP